MGSSLHHVTFNPEGFPLIMLHGWGHTLESLRKLGELLTLNAQIHLIDLPGFGRSDIPETSYSSFDYADRIIAYLDEKNIQKADFLGHSFGGKVSMSLAIRYPDRIRKLILLAPSGLRPKRTLRKKLQITGIKWLGKAIKKWDGAFKTALYSYFTLKFGSKDYQNAGPLRNILVRSVNEDLSFQIKQISSPTLILWGEEDTETPVEMAFRLHHLIKTSTLLIFPHKKHLAFEDVGSHLCAFHIIPFLQGHS